MISYLLNPKTLPKYIFFLTFNTSPKHFLCPNVAQQNVIHGPLVLVEKVSTVGAHSPKICRSLDSWTSWS